MSTEKHKYGIYICRCQPPHKVHITTMLRALDEVGTLIILIGSVNATPDVRNPFLEEERIAMIKAAMEPQLFGSRVHKKIHYIGINDYYYNENIWIAEVQNAIDTVTKNPSERSIALYGKYKDSTSYYLRLFPQWRFVEDKINSFMNATAVRKKLFTEINTDDGWKDKGGSKTDRCWRTDLPKEVASWLEKNFIYDSEGNVTERYKTLKAEFKFLEFYVGQWDDAPFPPTFNCADVVVIKAGHVLLVERLRPPGKGLIALPGGFIQQEETIVTAALRELHEETQLNIDERILRRSIVDRKVFDYPERSLRGRTISHAFHIDLGDAKPGETISLPFVKGADDAFRAFWMPLAQAITRNDFFEDHKHILYHFFVQERHR